MIVLIIYIALIITTAIVAAKIGRSSIGYAFLAFIFTPLVALVILAVLGRTEDNQLKRNIQSTYIEDGIREGLSFEEAKRVAKDKLNKNKTLSKTRNGSFSNDNSWIWEICIFIVFALLICIIIYRFMF